MAEINIGAITEALNNKSDIDLNNLNSEGQEKLDGEWVTPLEYNPIIENINLNSSTYLELDLTELLPKDNNIYECIISGTVTTGSTSGNNAYISLKQLNNNSNWFDVCRAQTRSSSTVGSIGSCIMPIGIDRKITLYRSTSLHGTVNNIKLNSYKKVR